MNDFETRPDKGQQYMDRATPATLAAGRIGARLGDVVGEKPRETIGGQLDRLISRARDILSTVQTTNDVFGVSPVAAVAGSPASAAPVPSDHTQRLRELDALLMQIERQTSLLHAAA